MSLPRLCAAFIGLAWAAAAPAAPVHPGLQLWSIRDQLKADPAAALDWARDQGFTEVETFDGGPPAAELARLLRARGLRAVSAHVGIPRLDGHLAEAVRDAHILGVGDIVCPIARPDQGAFDTACARRTAAAFNRWGRALKAAGLRFGYHPHGIEFSPVAPGSSETAFDVLMAETKPDLVFYEMDVFWIVHAGQDPVRLLARYPGRWRFLHLKDLRRGAATGTEDGRAPVADFVPLGRGGIDWPAVFAAAKISGVVDSFIEDESADPRRGIPESLKYLRGL